MLWGSTATSSPSLVFSKTFTSTNYSGREKTKNCTCLEQTATTSGPGGDQKHQVPASRTIERLRSEKELSSTPHTTAPKDSAGTHAHTRTHLCAHGTPLPSPSMESQGKDSLAGWS